jgi:stage IV sporulation protein FB
MVKEIYIYKGSKFNIKISPYFFAVLVFMLLTNYLIKFLVVFFSIMLHEAGHIAATVCCGKRVYALSILPAGLNASIEENRLTGLQKIFVYTSGPLVNILLAAAGLLLKTYCLAKADNILFFIWANIYLAIFNIMPVLPLDGGKILIEVITGRAGLFAAYRYLKAAAVVLFTVFIALGLLQFLLSMHNISLLMAGLYLYPCLKPERSEAALMNVKNIIYRRSRLLKKGVYAARDLVVMKSLHLGEVIKNMDFDRFHMIYVLDEDMRLMRLFTEQEIIEAMLKYNSDMTFEKLMETEAEGQST